MAILVTGGAGYIGSHTTHALLDRGEQVVVVDNLSTGLRALVPQTAAFVEGDIADRSLMTKVIAAHRVDAAIHFAGSVVVPESVADPLKYYRNNTGATCLLLEACSSAGVRHVIFSSTAAVYGTPQVSPVPESAAAAPISPYGRSKLMTEWMLEDAARAGVLDYIALRYFNVAGADLKGRTGQSTRDATHLIKRACKAALGRIPFLEIFGTDYPTPDGTGIRDYIHVVDLANAHLAALDALRSGKGSGVYNAGYGRGFSVRDVIRAVERVAGKPLPVREAPRRPGDPASVVADSSRLRGELGWSAQHDDLDEIVRSAYGWEMRLNE
jgi:UDP-glucose 4-epimerase